jgi:hypothetical protein
MFMWQFGNIKGQSFINNIVWMLIVSWRECNPKRIAWSLSFPIEVCLVIANEASIHKVEQYMYANSSLEEWLRKT